MIVDRHHDAGGAFLDIAPQRAAAIPLIMSPATCGFPSPADDYLDRPLDFNELLIENQAATFAVRIAGESMTGIGLFPGDIAVVDRARTAVDGSIVPALLGGAGSWRPSGRKEKPIPVS